MIVYYNEKTKKKYSLAEFDNLPYDKKIGFKPINEAHIKNEPERRQEQDQYDTHDNIVPMMILADTLLSDNDSNNNSNDDNSFEGGGGEFGGAGASEDY